MTSLTTPRFGFGGKDETQTQRPFPDPTQYCIRVEKNNFQVLGPHKIQIQPQFVQQVYQTVFRNNLEGSGFAQLKGLGTLLGKDKKDIATIRAFQIELGKQLSQMRSQELGLYAYDGFSLKYLGCSNKAKKNPMHLDTKSTDSLVLMLYEPTKNIKAMPFFTDLTQYAKDHGLDPLEVIQHDNKQENQDGSYRVKSHYGHQVSKHHQPELLAHYTYDLASLDPNDVEMVVFNDSLGLSGKGLSHGMRTMEIPDPSQPSERYFNHVVFDIQGRELNRPPQQKATAPNYYEKGPEESLQTPVHSEVAIREYIQHGKIFYRNPNSGAS